MVIIGIVGGVASGKSFVASQLERLGAQRIDVDRLGHEVLTEAGIRSALVERWGPTVVDAAGQINRKSVAKIVFAPTPEGSNELDFLERRTHPRIADRIKRTIEEWTQLQRVTVALLDAAVLLKAGWDVFCDKIIFVEAPRPLRLQRALARGWKQEEFAAREAAQESLDTKRDRADWVIDNSGPPERTLAQVQAFWQSLDNSSPPNY